MAVTPERTRLRWDYSPAPESADHVRLRESYGVFVGGEFADPRSGASAPTINPATEEPIADVAVAGADEIDMVISRQAYLAGDDARVVEEIVQVKEACGDAHLKVILETVELPSYDHVRHASMLAMEAGADFIKTSTGKAKLGATPGVVLVMLEALRDYTQRTGRVVGMKPAGGVSTSKQALHMLVLVKETLGDDWLTPERFRIGASSVLNDLLMQYEKAQTGRYGRAEDFSKE